MVRALLGCSCTLQSLQVLNQGVRSWAHVQQPWSCGTEPAVAVAVIYCLWLGRRSVHKPQVGGRQLLLCMPYRCSRVLQANICGANKTCKCSHLLKILDLWPLCQSPISILVQRCELLSRPLLLSRQHCNTSTDIVRPCCRDPGSCRQHKSCSAQAKREGLGTKLL